MGHVTCIGGREMHMKFFVVNMKNLDNIEMNV
jgi:hypothetical protein